MPEIRDEGIKDPHRYMDPPSIGKDFLGRAIGYVLKKIDENLEAFKEKFPASASRNLIYEAKENAGWTPGFWCGMLWLAYEVTGEEKYRRVAELKVQSFAKRIEEKRNVDMHDLGFLYSLSCVAAYKLTGNEMARRAAIEAADHLAARYVEKAGIIQAWGDFRDPILGGKFIIDCNMNLPLLYWASKETGDMKYHTMAESHIKQAARYLVREDASTYHQFYMDIETGRPIRGVTGQGFSDHSSWARGQAWAIYGFLLNYVYTEDDQLVVLGRKLANYFLNRLPDDGICYWDLIFTDGNEERDSSAAAIAVCGLMELAKHLLPKDPSGHIYENAAACILKSLEENYTTKYFPQSNGILMHAVYNRRSGKGVDECCIWGDYFYFEALVRRYKDWKLFW